MKHIQTSPLLCLSLIYHFLHLSGGSFPPTLPPAQGTWQCLDGLLLFYNEGRKGTPLAIDVKYPTVHEQ